jgi:hypothetical protein
MFGFKKKPPKNTNSPEFRRYMCEKLDGRALKYILERDPEKGDYVIGKGGVLSLYEGDFTVVCEGKALFVCKAEDLQAWEFMSLDGATLTGFDKVQGKERTVMACYTYYRD